MAVFNFDDLLKGNGTGFPAPPSPVPSGVAPPAPAPPQGLNGGGGGSQPATIPQPAPQGMVAPPAPASGGGEDGPLHDPHGQAGDCPPGQHWSWQLQRCMQGAGPGQGATVPPERAAGDMPCPAGSCKDVVTGECRSFNPRREKVNETDQWERPSGGGRGYCRQLDGGGMGGQGGGGVNGANGANGANGTNGSAESSDFAKQLRQLIEGVLNSPSRYTPEALQAMYGEIARQSSGQIERGNRGVRDEAARSGMQRAGYTQNAIQAVRQGAEQQRGSAVVGVQMAKINADFDDKMQGLDRAQRYLDSMRDNEYRYMLAADQRTQFRANLALAYANLAQQRSMLQMQLQAQRDNIILQHGLVNAAP